MPPSTYRCSPSGSWPARTLGGTHRPRLLWASLCRCGHSRAPCSYSWGPLWREERGHNETLLQWLTGSTQRHTQWEISPPSSKTLIVLRLHTIHKHQPSVIYHLITSRENFLILQAEKRLFENVFPSITALQAALDLHRTHDALGRKLRLWKRHLSRWVTAEWIGPQGLKGCQDPVEWKGTAFKLTSIEETKQRHCRLCDTDHIDRVLQLLTYLVPRGLGSFFPQLSDGSQLEPVTPHCAVSLEICMWALEKLLDNAPSPFPPPID